MCWPSPTTKHTRSERSKANKGHRQAKVGKGEAKRVTEGKCTAGKKGIMTEIMMSESEGEIVVYT